MKALRGTLVVLCALAAAPMTEAAGVDDLKAGVEAHKQGDHDGAIRLLTKAITSGELDAADLLIAFEHRGHAWNGKNDFDRAIADYSEAIRLNPQAWHAFILRGGAWREKKDFDRAIADYSEAIQLNPPHPHDAAFVFDRRGLVYLKLGNYGAAIADYSSAINLDPESASSRYGRGLARRLMGDRNAAEADIAAAMKADATIAEKYRKYEIHNTR
jgi:tetratricopeptide (TPR) repeat protein